MAMLINGLNVLRAEFNIVNPHRDHASDGWIGDDRHQAESFSDHNPDNTGVVHAIDVDVDGVPMARIVAFLVARCKSGKETRLQYIIYRRTIWSRLWGWRARRYLGINPHLKHAHFSARHADVAGNGRPWGVAAAFKPHPARPESAPAAGRPRPTVAHPPGSRLLALRQPHLTGADVVFVQQWIGPRRCGPADGDFGPLTTAGVKWYQGVRSLPRTGVMDVATWRNMGVRWKGNA